jgi:uncharacterized protein (TIGR02611 family)
VSTDGVDDQPRGMRHRARTHRAIRPFYRAGVFIVGLAVVAAGVAMLVLPGPGWAAIILGLVILASEFTWAERILDPIRRTAQAAAARALDPKHRRQTAIISVILLVLAAIAVTLYLVRYGLTLEPFPFL